MTENPIKISEELIEEVCLKAKNAKNNFFISIRYI